MTWRLLSRRLSLCAAAFLAAGCPAAVRVFYDDGAQGRTIEFASGADVTIQRFDNTSLVIIYTDNPAVESIGLTPLGHDRFRRMSRPPHLQESPRPDRGPTGLS